MDISDDLVAKSEQCFTSPLQFELTKTAKADCLDPLHMMPL